MPMAAGGSASPPGPGPQKQYSLFAGECLKPSPRAAHPRSGSSSPASSHSQAHASPPEPAPISRGDAVGDRNGTDKLQDTADATADDTADAATDDTPPPYSSQGDSLKRKALPSTMSTRASKVTRIRKACDICRMRKVKCDGTSPCKPCQALGAQCTFQYVSRHRGPVSRFAGGGWSSGGDASANTTAPVTAPVTAPATTTAAARKSDDTRRGSPGKLPSSPGFGAGQILAPVYLPPPMPLPQPPLPEAFVLPALPALDLPGDHPIDHADRSLDMHTPQSYRPTPAAPPVVAYSTSYLDINGQPQINIYPRMPRPPEQVPRPPSPPPPPPPSATDGIAPFHILELLVDDFFTYIHPLIPFPHEPTFRRRFSDPKERQTPRFLALLASMIGCLAASFPRSVRAHLRARHSLDKQSSASSAGGGKFARAICMVECCREVALDARGARFQLKPVLSVDDAATSYFLGLAAGYTFDWRLCRRFMAEAMSFVQELGFHRATKQSAVAGSAPVPAAYAAQPPYNHVDDQIGKRIFWILYLAMRSLIQLGATLSETPLPPFNNARPFPDLPAEVDDAYIEPGGIRAQPAGTVSLITGFNKTIQIYATMDPIATLEYACGLNQVPVPAQRTLYVEALKAVKAIMDTLPDELYLPLPGNTDAPHAACAADNTTADRASSDTSAPVEVFYDELSGYRYYPPAEDDAGQPSPVLRRSSSASSQRRPSTAYSRYAGAPTTPATPACRPDDLRLLLRTDPARRRQVQYDIQKTNIYASQLATRSYYVEMYLHLDDTKDAGQSADAPMAGERERIVHSLLFVLAAIPQYNMEPNGSALINKIRQVASTILGAAPSGGGVGTEDGTENGTGNGTATSPMEAQLIRFLEILVRLEKTGGPGGPGRPSASASASAASTVSSEEDVDEEEELQSWASLREEQMRFAASGGFLYNYV